MRVLLLHAGDADTEAVAAAAWAGRQSWDLDVCALAEVSPAAMERADAAWCHAGSSVPALDAGAAGMIARALAAGTHLVLTGLAAALAPRLGAPGDAPEVECPRPWRHADDDRWPEAFRDWPGYPHIRGCQGWGAHPLFEGLQGGAFTWMAREGDVVSRATFRRPAWGAGRVIAVDRSYVHLDADLAVAWEYDLGGRLTCIGANIAFASGDPVLHAARDVIVHNAIADRDGTASRTWWPSVERRHAPVSPLPRPRALAPVTVPEVPGLVRREPPDESPVTVGAARALVTGTLAGGVAEAWVHPLCVLDRVEVAADAGALVVTTAGASPVHAERELRDAQGRRWREVVAPHPEWPEVLVDLAPIDATDATMAFAFRVPMRRQWPYPADALAPLRAELRRQGSAATVLVTGCDGHHVAACFLDGVSDVEVLADDRAPVVRATGVPGQGLRLVVRATTEGSRGLGAVTTDLGAAIATAARRGDERRAAEVHFACGDATLTEAFEGARLRVAHFMADAPGGGRGLLAGYAWSRPGWNESRPGYAWFFGRDACWTIDALLAAGMFADARDAIALLARTADVTGKVIHEFTTSGVAHYDAADSTPLFVRAVAAWAEWTGDLGSVRTWWPAVQHAVRFVRACDRDGDGLPENTGVGHGWVEMGPLGGGAVTSYVAAIWIDALSRLVPVARALGDDAMAMALSGALAAAREGLEGLRLPDGRLALHRDSAGALFPATTALHAVPIALGVDVSSSVGAVLDELAAPRFLAPWGLRMLPSDDPRYDPVAYHAGTAWPLFTGWGALAACQAGRVDQGLDGVMAIARWATRGGTGGFAEVLRGDTGARAGVCPDQAWSAAMAVTPVVSGLAGARPNALARTLALRGALPRALPWMSLDRLRVGDTRVRARWERSGDVLTLDVAHIEGPAIEVRADGADARPCGPGARATWHLPDEGRR